jgi:hypothetical protein
MKKQHHRQFIPPGALCLDDGSHAHHISKPTCWKCLSKVNAVLSLGNQPAITLEED